MNKYPLWKNLLLLITFIVAIIYAIPNIFGDTPAVQISSTSPGVMLGQETLKQVEDALNIAHADYSSLLIKDKNIQVRFADTDAQLKAEGILKQTLGDQYIIALNLESATPTWLIKLGAYPMKLGLDLRGGVHFLMQVDVDSVIKHREKNEMQNIREELRHKKVRYTGIALRRQGGIKVRFANKKEMSRGESVLNSRFPEFLWEDQMRSNQYELIGRLSPAAIQQISQYTIEQTMSTLRRRVNELGVSEAVVQQQGKDRISVDLPGIQDAAQAKDILGKTATLEFHLVDMEHDLSEAVAGLVPVGSELHDFNSRPTLLKSQILLTGDSITHATATFDQNGRPSVSIRLGGGGESLFERVTAENVGKMMAVVYVEVKSEKTTVNGQDKIIYKKLKRVINEATIQSALGRSFQITGLDNPVEAANLALLLRAGSLPAAVTIIEERTVGPSMGKRNIHLGMLSIEVGMLLIIIFMALYYGLFGIVADIGLIINLVLLIALLSLLGATLTFPGIAGIVLTVGMAIDYNVLIYERIREELRNGMTPQAAIHTGYDKAFMTIIDANVTTLIVALILFALGTGPVKGFAITLVIGLFTSIISSVTYSRALVNLIYGNRRVKRLSIGIKH
jgi:preprotein translocase subunit SecD